MKAIVLGGVAPHISLIQRLKERGYTVLLIDYLDDPPAKKSADQYFQVSTLDAVKVRDIAVSEGVDVIMAACVDHANVTMCTVAEQLGLPHPYSSETAVMVTDKSAMKARMKEFGIPTSDYVTVKGTEEIPWETLRYPLVVKPADNNGSKGVKRVDDAESLLAGVENAIKLSRSGNAIIEGFNAGREIQVDCFVNRGEAHVLTIREKLGFASVDCAAMQVFGSVVPAELPDEIIAEYGVLAQGIADAFGLEHTPFFFQTITDGSAISVLELSPRIGGGLSYKLIKDSVGVDIIDLAIDSYFGDIPLPEIRQSKNILASTIVYAEGGTLAEIEGVGALLEDGTIEDWDQIASIGTAFGSAMDSRNRVGACYSSASTYAELKEMTKRVESVVNVVGEDGRSLKVKGLFYK